MAFWTDKHCDECFGTGLDPQGREDTLCAACHGYGAHPLKVETSGWQMARSLSARQISIGVNGFIKSKLNILSSRPDAALVCPISLPTDCGMRLPHT